MSHTASASPRKRQKVAKSKDESKKVFDVAKPGKTAASASSRPLIIGHKTLLQDPMVTRTPLPSKAKKIKPDSSDLGIDETASGEPEEEIKLLTPPETNIEPPNSAESDKDRSSEEIEDSEDMVPAEHIEIIKTKEPDEPKPEEDSPKPDKIEVPTESDDASESVEVKKIEKPKELAVTEEDDQNQPVNDSISDEPEPAPQETISDLEAKLTVSDKSEDKTSEDDKKKNKSGKKSDDAAEAGSDAAYQKLIYDKTYFVPIGDKKRKRSMRRLLLLIILLLIVAIGVANVLIDNGTIKTDIEPIVDL